MPKPPPHHVDYDRIAAEYDRRYDNVSLQGCDKALLALADRMHAQRVLEVGCGTGHWLMVLRSNAPHLFGLDLSRGMLEQAQKLNVDLQLARGTATQLPFRDGQLDLIYCINAIHHFDDPRAFIGEAFRSLRPGGVCTILSSDPRRDVWYVYSYFETAYATDLARFPSREELASWMMEAKFEQVGMQIVEEIKQVFEGRRVLDDPFIRKNSCSQLMLLSDQAYQEGIARIENALREAEARSETLSFRSEIFTYMLIGYKAKK